MSIGAFYADPNGFLYASSNSTGKIWRVDINATPLTAIHIADGPPSGANDGARCALAPIPTDFGDAPDAYGTLLAANGPRHNVIGYNSANNTASLMLGKTVDIETDGYPDPNAKGDDTHGIDDEDGVTHIVATPGVETALSIPVTVTNTSDQGATVVGWVDLNNNSTFEASERVSANVPANSGTQVYELNFPSTIFNANSSARFRLFAANDTSDAAINLSPIGSAAGGEVEDFQVQVGTYEVKKTSTPASGSVVTPDDTITYKLKVTNTGLTDLIGLTLHDDLSDVLDDAVIVGDPTVTPSSAGSAVVDNDALEFEFVGDILTGQSVTVTYSVKVKDAGALGNNQVNNMILAAHSNCHPDVVGGQHYVSNDPSCHTTHAVEVSGLADTGSNILLPIGIGGGLIAVSLAVIYADRRLVSRRGKLNL